MNNPNSATPLAGAFVSYDANESVIQQRGSPVRRGRPDATNRRPSFSPPVDMPCGAVNRLADLHDLMSSSPVTWVFAGDSITQGALYTEGWRSFTEHFAERVRWEMRRFADVVINTGVVGGNSTDLLANLEAQALRFRPDVVLILIGMNEAVTGSAGHFAFRKNMYEIVGQIREAEAIPVLQTPNTVYQPFAELWKDLPAYVDIIREVAQESGSPLVDHWQHWQQAKPDPAARLLWLQDQSIHPNVYGHREMARLVCRALGIFDSASLTCRLESP